MIHFNWFFVISIATSLIIGVVGKLYIRCRRRHSLSVNRRCNEAVDRFDRVAEVIEKKMDNDSRVYRIGKL